MKTYIQCCLLMSAFSTQMSCSKPSTNDRQTLINEQNNAVENATFKKTSGAELREYEGFRAHRKFVWWQTQQAAIGDCIEAGYTHCTVLSTVLSTPLNSQDTKSIFTNNRRRNLITPNYATIVQGSFRNTSANELIQAAPATVTFDLAKWHRNINRFEHDAQSQCQHKCSETLGKECKNKQLLHLGFWLTDCKQRQISPDHNILDVDITTTCTRHAACMLKTDLPEGHPKKPRSE